MLSDTFASRGAGGPAVVPPTQAITTQILPEAPVQPTTFDQWGAIIWVFGGVIAVALFINSITEIVERFLNWRRRDEDEDAGEIGNISERVKELEVSCRDFITKSEVTAEMERLRENRRGADQASAEKFGRHDDRLSAIEREQTRMATEQKGQSETLARIERTVEGMAERFDDKLDRIAASVGKAPPRAMR